MELIYLNEVIRVSPNAIGLVSKGKKKEGNLDAEIDTGRRWPSIQAKEHLRLLEAKRWSGTGPSLMPTEGAGPCRHPDSGFWPPELRGDKLLSFTPRGGDLLGQP